MTCNVINAQRNMFIYFLFNIHSILYFSHTLIRVIVTFLFKLEIPQLHKSYLRRILTCLLSQSTNFHCTHFANVSCSLSMIFTTSKILRWYQLLQIPVNTFITIVTYCNLLLLTISPAIKLIF